MGSIGASRTIEPSRESEFDNALYNGKAREITAVVKNQPVGTELEFRVNNIPRTYTRVEGNGAKVWRDSRNDTLHTHSEVGGFLQTAFKRYSTLAQFYNDNFKVR